MCFVDMTKDFDRVRSKDVFEIRGTKDLNQSITYNNKKKYIYIYVNTGIRQGDSPNPFIFNSMMDKTINIVTIVGFEMGNTFFHTVSHVGDAVIIVDCEHDFQTLIRSFDTKAK